MLRNNCKAYKKKGHRNLTMCVTLFRSSVHHDRLNNQVAHNTTNLPTYIQYRPAKHRENVANLGIERNEKCGYLDSATNLLWHASGPNHGVSARIINQLPRYCTLLNAPLPTPIPHGSSSRRPRTLILLKIARPNSRQRSHPPHPTAPIRLLLRRRILVVTASDTALITRPHLLVLLNESQGTKFILCHHGAGV